DSQSARRFPVFLGLLMVLGSMSSVQLGGALSPAAMNSYGALSITWLRLAFATMLLLPLTRPKIMTYQTDQWLYALALGGAIALMTSLYFLALQRIPLGLATSIEFLGPLAVAFFAQRGWRRFAWPVLAMVGILLLVRDLPRGNVAFTGIGMALGAAFGWGSYILLMKKVGKRFGGFEGLALSLLFACILALPAALLERFALPAPQAMLAAAGLALFVPLLPYALEMMALRRLPLRSFGIMMSLEPAIGALIGFIILKQALSALQMVGIACVILASIASVGAEEE
ncbi:MAG TPA: EamA family transporter, partial [Dongiaceae bacterium]|nr:EamA family transporter [Dongiaceae bacterium]